MPDATLAQLLDAADRDLYKNKWINKHPEEARAAANGEDQVVDLPPTVNEIESWNDGLSGRRRAMNPPLRTRPERG